MTGKLKSRSITSYHKSFPTEGIDFSKFQQSSLDSCLGEELKDEQGTAIHTFSTTASELDGNTDTITILNNFYINGTVFRFRS